MSSAYAPHGVATRLPLNGLIAITWVGAALGILFTAARIAIRIKYMSRLMADDYLMLLALIFLITNAILQTIQAPHLYYMILQATGQDIVHHALRYTHFEFAIISIFWSVLWSVKGSFLALFWMLSDGLPRYRRVWWVITVFTVLAYIGCWLASVLNCHPPENYFKFGQCSKAIDQEGSVISISYSTAVDILTDLLIMSLPFFLIWGTRINFQQKVGLVIVFSFGLFIIAAAIVRAIEITGKAYSDQAALAIWSIAESSISMIVGCLPPFRAVISKGPSGTQYRYGFSSANSVSYPASSRVHLRSNTTNWSESPLPVQDHRQYRNLDFEMNAPKNVHVDGGEVAGRSKSPNERLRARNLEINMVQGFSVVSQ